MSVETENEKELRITPMMQQWKECKETAKDAVLFFRLGDFYEAFYEDAKIASKELDLTLTQRQDVPMCGIPWHTSDGYIERLVQKGHKVAIAEQVEDPKKAKGLVTRRVVRIVSPATLASATSNEKGHSFFAAVSAVDGKYGLSLIDLVTASFWTYEFSSSKELVNELFRQSPKELLVSQRFQAKEGKLLAEITQNNRLLISAKEDWLFDPVQAEDVLLKHFTVKTLDGYGLKEMHASVVASGALIQYLRDWQMCPVDHLRVIRPQNATKTMQLDRGTLVNLEILEPIDKQHPHNCLRAVLDATKTPMGARLLTQWLKSPLLDKGKISARHDAVNALQHHDFADSLDEHLENIRDLEKLIYRIKNASSGPREYVSLRQSLEQLPHIKTALKEVDSELIQSLSNLIEECEPCVEKIRNALVDAPPFKVSDGGLFKPGYCADLDELQSLRQNSRDWLLQYQTRLREELGVKTLKVGYNRMFGYYIEVSRAQCEKMPETLIRRQTLVNGERYISPELKEFEEKILSADARIQEIEERLFAELKADVALWHEAILRSAASIAGIDVLRSFALVAKRRNYKRPEIDDSRVLSITDGRHPVIESLAHSEHFVPNDIFLDGRDAALLCITGPNMAGKSTYIRQVALLVIMAQIGSFVPATSAKIGIVDKLFSRIGASDDLARGQSTFMVEMAETASILHQATDRSLVILDEIGRGTSTYDGISIAWAVAEFLLKREHGNPKTLFATHYFELTDLKNKLVGVQNATVAISETDDGIVFLRKVVPGTTDKSYGVHVARLAGMPEAVIKRATEFLQNLEKGEKIIKKEVEIPRNFNADLFTNAPENRRTKLGRELAQTIVEMDINHMTPMDALNKIYEWKKLFS